MTREPVRVRFHGTLQLLESADGSEIAVVLEDGASVGDLLDRLDAGGKAWIVARDGAVVSRTDPAPAGAEFDLYGHLEGG